ncbi:hypothetical protein [Taibaiella koreensis]|uniref:hypothetical protein n=1 Tax=Taibaiella koreensis TaxID=1268548 RepID=UPI000E5A047E|nr:hypothetical protein [Taibaiella koreensis]
MKPKLKVKYRIIALSMLVDAGIQACLFLYCWYCIGGYGDAGIALTLLVIYEMFSALAWLLGLWREPVQLPGGCSTRILYLVLSGMVLLALILDHPAPYLLIPVIFYAAVLLSVGLIGYYFLFTLATIDFYSKWLQQRGRTRHGNGPAK